MGWWELSKAFGRIWRRKALALVRAFPLAALLIPAMIGIGGWGLLSLRQTLVGIASLYGWPEGAFVYGRLFGLWGALLFLSALSFLFLLASGAERSWLQLASAPLLAWELWVGLYALPVLLVSLGMGALVAIPFSAFWVAGRATVPFPLGLGIFGLWIAQAWGWGLLVLRGVLWRRRPLLRALAAGAVGGWHLLPLFAFPFPLDALHPAALLRSLCLGDGSLSAGLLWGIQAGEAVLLWAAVLRSFRSHPLIPLQGKKDRWSSRRLTFGGAFLQILLNEGKRIWRPGEQRLLIGFLYLLVSLILLLGRGSAPAALGDVLLLQTLPLLIGLPFLIAFSQDLRGEWALRSRPYPRLRYLTFKLWGHALLGIPLALIGAGIGTLFLQALPSAAFWGALLNRTLGALGVAFLVGGILRIPPGEILGHLFSLLLYTFGLPTVDFFLSYLGGLAPLFAGEGGRVGAYLALFFLAPLAVWGWERAVGLEGRYGARTNPGKEEVSRGDSGARRSFLA